MKKRGSLLIILIVASICTLASCRQFGGGDSDVKKVLYPNVGADLKRLVLATQVDQSIHEQKITEFVKFCDTLSNADACPQFTPKLLLETYLTFGQIKVLTALKKIASGNFLGENKEAYALIESGKLGAVDEGKVARTAKYLFESFEHLLTVDFITMSNSIVMGNDTIFTPLNRQTYGVAKTVARLAFVELPEKTWRNFCKKKMSEDKKDRRKLPGCDSNDLIAYRYFLYTIGDFGLGNIYNPAMYTLIRLGAFLPDALADVLLLFHPTNFFKRVEHFIKNIFPGDSSRVNIGSYDPLEFHQKFTKVLKVYYQQHKSYRITEYGDSKKGLVFEIRPTENYQKLLKKSGFSIDKDSYLLRVKAKTRLPSHPDDFNSNPEDHGTFDYESIGIKVDKEEYTEVKITIPALTYKAYAWHQKSILKSKQVVSREVYEREFAFEIKALVQVVYQMMETKKSQ